jgi:hypothetical protein
MSLLYADGHLPVGLQNPNVILPYGSAVQIIRLPWTIISELYWRAAKVTISLEFTAQITANARSAEGGFYTGTGSEADPYVWNVVEPSVAAINSTLTHAEVPVESFQLARWHYLQTGVNEFDEPTYSSLGPILEQFLIEPSYEMEPGYINEPPRRFARNSLIDPSIPAEVREENEDTPGISNFASNYTSLKTIEAGTSDSIDYFYPAVKREGNDGLLGMLVERVIRLEQVSSVTVSVQDGPAPGTIIGEDSFTEGGAINLGLYAFGGSAFFSDVDFVIRWGNREIIFPERWKIYRSVISTDAGISVSGLKVALHVDKFYTYGGIYDEDTGERV